MNNLMKLAGQLGLVYVGLLILSAAFGKGSTAPTPGKARNMNAPGGTNAYQGRYSSFGAQLERAGYKSEVSAPYADSEQSPGTYAL